MKRRSQLSLGVAAGFLFAGLLALSALLAAGCGAPTAPAAEGPRTQSPIDALIADGRQEGFSFAEQPREFIFPEDHGPHPDFQTEWWYVTGQVATAEGRRFGLQWTIFRRALTPDMAPRTSTWASRQLFMGHMALADIEGERHLSAERFARGAAGLAGAEIRPFRVWLEDWQASSNENEDIWPMRLESSHRGEAGAFDLDLELVPEKKHVLQGDRGLSFKHAGGASFYYSFTRLAATGKIELDGEIFEVSGEAWLDREWSTSTLDETQAGWDWFSLQLADRRDLMFYQLRQKDGAADPMSAGVLVDAEGEKTTLTLHDIELEVLDRWRSPRSDGEYPVHWRLRVPGHGIDWEIRPFFPDQELNIAFRYWEGAVEVRPWGTGRDRSGEHGDASIGHGYVELVGYAEE